MSKTRWATIQLRMDDDQLTDHYRAKIPADVETLTLVCAELGTTFTLTTKRRYCNRCNRLLASIEHEPTCTSCQCPEFRLALPNTVLASDPQVPAT